ncbi:TolC family protein [Clostridiaceae bacterium M8S5]|nr:TolC family protein [Clostridiaceae bacterium M8S5]
MKKRVSLILIFSLCFITVTISYAQNDNTKLNSYTLEQCIDIALENNLTIKKIKQELKISEFNKKRTNRKSRKILDSEDSLDIGWAEYDKNKKIADNTKKLLSSIQDAPDPNAALVDMKNKNMIDDNTYNLLHGKDKSTMDGIINNMKSNIDGKINASYGDLRSSDAQLDDVNNKAGSVISSNLKLSTNVKLSVKSTTELLDAIANINYDITKAGFDISKKQIAMLVENNYYEALKKQKIVGAKEKSLDRAKGQYDIIKNAYDEGLKAKDDLLLAKANLELINVELEKATCDAHNAKIDLLNSLNIPLDTDINIVDVPLSSKDVPSLEDGIKQGLEKRLEIKQSLGKYVIDSLNHELTSRSYPDITNQYKEALYKKEHSQIELEIQQKSIEADIRKNYETMVATSKMYEHVKNSVLQMEENLKIATFKYNEGIGFSSANLDSDELGGTIMEVLAASEKLAQIEEKVVEIEYAKNISITKYLNSIGEY